MDPSRQLSNIFRGRTSESDEYTMPIYVAQNEDNFASLPQAIISGSGVRALKGVGQRVVD